MVEFIGGLSDEHLAEKLWVAIDGRGAFRRFKDVLHDDEAAWDAWSIFSSERRLGRARWWLADAGLRPATSGDAPIGSRR